MALATSSGVPSRRSGICSTIFSVPGDRIAVSISPGEMALTRTPERPEIGRHLAGQRCQRGFRGGIGRAREGMHARAGDGGDVDDRALGRPSVRPQAARQHDRGEEVDVEDVDASPRSAVSMAPRREPPWPFGEMPALLTSACSTPPSTASRSFTSAMARRVSSRIGEVDLEVILRSHLPGAVLRERRGASR